MEMSGLSKNELLKIAGGQLSSESTTVSSHIGKILELPDGKFTYFSQEDSRLKNEYKDCKIVGTLVSALGYTFQYDENNVLKKIITVDGKIKELDINSNDFKIKSE